MKKIKLKASGLKNIIKEIKRRIILEGTGPLRGICMHRDDGETNPGEVVAARACRTSESPASGNIECMTDEDCMGGGVWNPHHSSPNNPQFTLGGCYCDKSPANGEAGGSTKTNTYVDRPGGEDASTGAIEENIKRSMSNRKRVKESHLNRIVKKVLKEEQLLIEGIKCTKKTEDVDCDFGVFGKAKCVDGECGEIIVSTRPPQGPKGPIKLDIKKLMSESRLNEQSGDWNAWLNADAEEQCRLCKYRFWTTSQRDKYCRCSSCVCTTGQTDKNLLCHICKTIHWTTSKRNKYCRCKTCPCSTGVPTTTNLGVDKDFRGPSEFDGGGAQSHEWNPGGVTPLGPGIHKPGRADGVVTEEVNRMREIMGILNEQATVKCTKCENGHPISMAQSYPNPPGCVAPLYPLPQDGGPQDPCNVTTPTPISPAGPSAAIGAPESEVSGPSARKANPEERSDKKKMKR